MSKDKEKKPPTIQDFEKLLDPINDELLDGLKKLQMDFFDKVTKKQIPIALASISYNSALVMVQVEFARIWADSMFKRKSKNDIKAQMLAQYGQMFDIEFEDVPHKRIIEVVE